LTDLARQHVELARRWIEAKLKNTDQAAEGKALSDFVGAHRDLPLERLATVTGLRQFEYHLLLLCWTVDRWPDEMFELLQPLQPTRPQPAVTFQLGFKIFGDDRAAMLPQRPLRRYRLVEIVQPPEQGLSSATLRVDEHVAAFADGYVSIDGRPRLDAMLTPYLRPLDDFDPGELSDAHAKMADRLIKQWARHPGPGSSATAAATSIVSLTGRDCAGKLAIAALAAKRSRRASFMLSTSQLPVLWPDVDLLAALWNRDSLLHSLALVIDNDRDDVPIGELTGRRTALERLIHQLLPHGVAVLTTHEISGARQPEAVMEVAKPARTEQQRLWFARLAPLIGDVAADAEAGELSWQFNFSAGAIAQITENVAATASPATASENDTTAFHLHLRDACRRNARLAFDSVLAERLTTQTTLTDIVLPPAQMELLRRIKAQVSARFCVYERWEFAAHTTRGLGISALFAGESGTGKTMAAEALATELEMDLYRIDLSSVVSKYIGETERNLRRLFDAAEEGGSILFFDEADALFGKRSEVKDSHDRYSNIEINYLLQRMESYQGLAVLATNMKSALDQAFMRRLRFVVDFPAPSVIERRRIWSRAFPATMLKQAANGNTIDLDRLARLKLVGGNISSIALNAAFLAADQRRGLTTELVLEVARDEFTKLGRHVVEEDLGPRGVNRAQPRQPAAGVA
jgi:hypothetical protein